MPKIKTDGEMRSEFMPRIKAFTDNRLNASNAKQIYDYLKPYGYDKEGWRLYEAAKGILQADVCSAFPTEDNLGYFETLDGFGLLKWLEIAKFADKEYEQLPGGYEKLKSHTLDEKSPAYQEFRGKLYVAAIRSITVSLAAKQPHLLESFFSRVSYIENILMKGFPTRESLNEKIKREAEAVFATASEGDLTGFHSEVELKQRIRDELHEIFMSEEMVQALTVKDNVLDDAYRFYLEENKDNQVFLAVFEYLEKAEHDYLAERVFDRAKLAYEDYVDEVKTLKPQEIIDAAYKLTTLYDIYISLEPIDESSLTTKQLRGLMSLDNPLFELYDEWQSRDDSRMDEIKDVIIETADERAAEIAVPGYEDESDAEDGLEP